VTESIGCRGTKCLRSGIWLGRGCRHASGRLAVTESTFEEKARDTHASSLGADHVFRPVTGATACHAGLLRLWQVRRRGADGMIRLRESVLGYELLALEFLNAVCNSAILASLTSRRRLHHRRGRMALVRGCGFLPPVSHIIRTISNAKLMRSQDWTFFGRGRAESFLLHLIGLGSWVAPYFAEVAA